MSTSSPGTSGGDPPTPLPPTPPSTDDARFANGLPDNADAEARLAFFKYCLSTYRRMDWTDKTLSEYFADDFKPFTLEHMNAIPNNDRRVMRDLLRKRGVFVRKGRGVLIADALYEVVQTDVPWPDGESTDVDPPGGDDNSRRGDQPSRTPNKDDDANSNSQRKPAGPNGNSGGSSNGISNLAKAYHFDADRYSGMPTDNFDRKLCLFHERCQQSNVAADSKHLAFSIMLAGRARDFYFDNLRDKGLSFEELVAAVKRRFITAEHERTLVREWDSLSLNAIMSENVGKPRKHCLEELVGRMHALQSGLPSAYRNDEIFKNKLLNAVKDVESCRFAYFKPADTVEGLISDLHSSLAVEPSSKSSPAVDAHFIDRRFKGQRGRTPDGKGSHRKDLSCLVCHKKGCWSTNHSKEERIAALRKNRQVRQFLTTVSDSEGGDSAPVDEGDENRDLDDAQLEELEDLAGPALVVQIDVDVDDCDEDEQPTCYFATTDDDDNATAYIASARDAAVSHALTATFDNDSRYNDEFFYGVMIDTGCARASSGGLPQYRAYCRYIGQTENIDTSKTCLLYTSPSPRDLSTSRMPSSA